MKAAFAIWNQRIAPVFDVASTICMVTLASGEIKEMQHDFLLNGPPMQRVRQLLEAGIDTLICGAISQSLQAMLTANGIHVIAFVAGDFKEVCQAWQNGKLDEKIFAMPGCGIAAVRHGRKNSVVRMKGPWRSGDGASGSRPGQGARRAGRGGAATAGTFGQCVCPQCGNTELHQRGVPCAQKKCIKCGTPMVRQ